MLLDHPPINQQREQRFLRNLEFLQRDLHRECGAGFMERRDFGLFDILLKGVKKYAV